MPPGDAGGGVDHQPDDQHDDAGHRDPEQEQARHGEAVRRDHQFREAALPEEQAVHTDGGDEQDGGRDRRQHGDEIDAALEAGQLVEPALERQGEQEAGEELDAGLHDAQLLQQTRPVPVQSLHGRLVPDPLVPVLVRNRCGLHSLGMPRTALVKPPR